MRRRRRETQEQLRHGADALRWFDGSALLERLAEQQTRLVADALARAGRAEAASQENARLARDLAGSLDRIQEVHHRIRNHLQTLTGLLSAQEVSERSPTARRALQESVFRLTSVAAIHDLLARDPLSGKLRLPELAERLASDLLRQAGAEKRLRVKAQVAPIVLAPREATAFVLILTELLSNAIEHGFAGGGEGVITLRVMQKRGQAVLEVRDTGPGLPAGFELSECESLGLRLVARLAERDLGGSAAAWNAKGACFRVAFPVRDVGREA
jgi:two-component sensor histidine kinase